jgi:hypothetical protein
MIIVAASGTIAGGASVGSKITCTLIGLELHATTLVETYKVLDQRQLANSPATIYTATANGPTFVKSIFITNTDTVVRTFRLFIGGTADANAITPNYSLLPGGQAVYNDGMGWQFYNSTGQLLTASGMSYGTAEDNYGITGSFAETIQRWACPEVNTTIATTGQIFCHAIYLSAGTLVSNISFHSATTGAGTPTHYVFALYDLSRNLLASSADQLTAAWAANTLKTLAMGTPYLVPTTGLYYVAISMVATTVPTLKGGTARTGGQLAGQAPIISGISSTTYASGTAPASIGALTVGTTSAWACVT